MPMLQMQVGAGEVAPQASLPYFCGDINLPAQMRNRSLNIFQLCWRWQKTAVFQCFE
jgi:hypothetical protein